MRHLADIVLDLESARRGGSTRKAECTCGWRGPERATLIMAADDAMVHESEYVNSPTPRRLASMDRDVYSIGVGCTTLDVEMARKHEWTEDDIQMAREMIRAAVLETNRRVAARRGHIRQCAVCECWTRPQGPCHLCEKDREP